MVHRFTSAAWWSVGILVGAAALSFLLVNARSQAVDAPELAGGDELAGEGDAVPVITH